jgi:cytochrome c oxidase subunit III
MGREATARKTAAQGASAAPVSRRALLPVFGGGPPSPPGEGTRIGNGRIAIVMLLGAETMLFTPLIGSYLVLRSASLTWPPLDQPRLPILVTWANTLVLTASCLTMRLAKVAVVRRSPLRLERWLTMTALLGTAFLAVQGSEWIRLIRHGLTVSSGVYGGTFYVLIGFHGLHVLGAVVWLLGVLFRARANRFSSANAVAVDLVGLYWYFVGALWLVLFPLVYLF